jgi:hypothetical protein
LIFKPVRNVAQIWFVEEIPGKVLRTKVSVLTTTRPREKKAIICKTV